MTARRGGPTDDFSSDEAAPESGPHLDPTRTGSVQVGLEELDERGETAFHAIVADEFHIGRGRECNLVIRGDSKTSRRHATITREPTAFVIRDDGSANGTKVNDAKISGPVTLKFGDKIEIGHRVFTFNRRL
ncbi:MAG: FHA domain-containing protein [Planctomycetes bacterium]|nr:FHA domain-containing protein [Planctomycetota bacterium]